MNSPYQTIVSFILIIMPLLGAIAMIVPNCLSLGLQTYQQSLGSSGALFGLFYYIILSSLMFVLTLLHENPHLKLSLYFIGLAVVLKVASRKLSPK